MLSTGRDFARRLAALSFLLFCDVFRGHFVLITVFQLVRFSRSSSVFVYELFFGVPILVFSPSCPRVIEPEGKCAVLCTSSLSRDVYGSLSLVTGRRKSTCNRRYIAARKGTYMTLYSARKKKYYFSFDLFWLLLFKTTCIRQTQKMKTYVVIIDVKMWMALGFWWSVMISSALHLCRGIRGVLCVCCGSVGIMYFVCCVFVIE